MEGLIPPSLDMAKAGLTLTGTGALGGVINIMICPADRTDQTATVSISLTKCKLLLRCFIVIIIIIMLHVRLNLSENIILFINHLISYLLE